MGEMKRQLLQQMIGFDNIKPKSDSFRVWRQVNVVIGKMIYFEMKWVYR